MTDHAQTLTMLEQGTSPAIALAFFDSLPPAELADLPGAWRGRGVPTGHPLDGMLERFGWHGKRFESTEEAHPLVFTGRNSVLVSVDPARIPIGMVVRVPGLVNTAFVARLFRLGLPLLRTRKPAAQLRMTEHRGVLTATMIYDALPINDIFRKAGQDTLLGLMDLRGMEEPFFFILRREGD
jgi:hypothetical protein